MISTVTRSAALAGIRRSAALPTSRLMLASSIGAVRAYSADHGHDSHHGHGAAHDEHGHDDHHGEEEHPARELFTPRTFGYIGATALFVALGATSGSVLSVW
ncbi:uncharacterized protein V1518DRAFT_407263 [Limtongia smithiae]|uniref:uncharacterized protein n=1 Tax=Limtongia smithiae TaxID=1125753 RepID=UPI0034CEEA12